MREKKDWSQVELARRVGMNNSVLSRIEANKRPVETEELKKFAEVFNVTTDFLSGASEAHKPAAAPSTSYLEAHKNAAVIAEVADKYGIDLTDPVKRQQLEEIVKIIAMNHVKNSGSTQ